ncbi:hypothetical protein LTR22_015720 [Elasticomyces elasticus]|nr:hypothetical protein LTR22_015720 [Elasticomyces elasticus]KAK4930244.1 hypothetical protein LTR49_003278 [Elasticomyces elasticus]KAK5761407.1 hypothetical protein LTS12_008511 [Elasticomyces elasticus]
MERDTGKPAMTHRQPRLAWPTVAWLACLEIRALAGHVYLMPSKSLRRSPGEIQVVALLSRFRYLVVLAGLLSLIAILTVLAIGGNTRLDQVAGKLNEYGLDKLQKNVPVTTDNKAPKKDSDQEPLNSVLVSDDEDDDSVEGYDADGDDEDQDDDYNDRRGDYREIFSLTTRDRKFFPIFFAGDDAYNPNIIPHPTRHDLWIVVAQHEQSKEQISVSGELVCEAGFLDGVLVCTDAPTILPISPSISGVCPDDLAFMNFRSGPRDARMFYGPDGPLIAYGSQSQYACLGIWIQDVRMLLESFHLERFAVAKLFKSATEVQRPPPWHGIEKNFFLFWDLQGKTYVHR